MAPLTAAAIKALLVSLHCLQRLPVAHPTLGSENTSFIRPH